ncbi:DOPA-like domain-containing protein [Epithele typhae]|uniref:DOPA-like domain-containing protein n=1 Tax=Epithele typhae TaxID=378194 RepID=UPI002007538D|nr:DOPA-like domain-containing protein [Epithele typhae]KAH9935968.1 DOPA-like domain-containing protein [Epithele typhae]
MVPQYKSPLLGYENWQEPLPTGFNADGKSLINPSAPRSEAYDIFPKPIDSSNNGFDFHIYHIGTAPDQVKYARELHERIRREFPEFRVYKFWDKPVGPHPVPMFEVNVFNPHQVGTFFAWLVVNRGPLSVLVHPNTDDALADHTELATWMGKPFPLNTNILVKFDLED